VDVKGFLVGTSSWDVPQKTESSAELGWLFYFGSDFFDI